MSYSEEARRELERAAQHQKESAGTVLSVMIFAIAVFSICGGIIGGVSGAVIGAIIGFIAGLCISAS